MTSTTERAAGFAQTDHRPRGGPTGKLLVSLIAAMCLVVGPLAAGAQATTGTDHPFAAFFVGNTIEGGSNVAGVFIATNLGFGHFQEQTSLLFNDPGVVAVFGTHTQLSAVNGESLNADGVIVQLGPFTKDCQGNSLIGEANFTGGTGRFANATGLTHFVGCIHRDVSPPRVTGFSFGTLNF